MNDNDDDAPEQEDDRDPVGIRRIPDVLDVHQHRSEVGDDEGREQDGEHDVHDDVPPATDPDVIVPSVDEIPPEGGNAESEVTSEASRCLPCVDHGLPAAVPIAPDGEGDEEP